MKTFLLGPASALLGAALGASHYGENAGSLPDAHRSGAWIAVSGTVVALDRSRGTLGFRHAALETAAAGTENCRVAHPGSLQHLHPGQDITALAETDRHPWILDEVRIVPAQR